MSIGTKGEAVEGGGPGTCPTCRARALMRVYSPVEDGDWWLCPKCDNGHYVWLIEPAPVEYESEFATCRVCWHDKPLKKTVVHHVSYCPERTVRVCGGCHYMIHNDSEFRPDLTPKMSRMDAEREGYV